VIVIRCAARATTADGISVCLRMIADLAAVLVELRSMKNASPASKASRGDGDFYRAFLALDRGRRNQEILADLYDHFLIREAMREKGRSVSWKSYLRAKGSRVR